MKKENKILNLLTDTWNLFIKLSKEHPDEERDFADGIHKCQYIIGMRFARIHFKNIFPIKFNNNTCPNCLRIIPNKQHRRRWGCKWCIPEKPTQYCNGKF